MSGGSHNYIYSRLSQECEGEMHDTEMDCLINDLCDVLHDLEWWQSGDYSEDQYRETVSEFKKKWFKGDRQERLKGYIDEQIETVRHQLYSLIGEPQESEIADEGCPNRCIDCKYFDGHSHYTDNINISACVAGSCIKCQRNLVTSDPYNEVPSWCPLKGDINDQSH